MNLLTKIGALALLAAPSAVWAQAAPDLNARLAAMEAATKSAQSAGDNAWMLVSCALVLMMTAPGLALFYGGLVRRKNVLGTMMHSFILMAVVTVIWAVVGLQPGLRRIFALPRQFPVRLPQWRRRRAQRRITPAPSRTPPSWCIS